MPCPKRDPGAGEGVPPPQTLPAPSSGKNVQTSPSATPALPIPPKNSAKFNPPPAHWAIGVLDLAGVGAPSVFCLFQVKLVVSNVHVSCRNEVPLNPFVKTIPEEGSN